MPPASRQLNESRRKRDPHAIATAALVACAKGGQLDADLTLQLELRGRPLQLPKTGIDFSCEVCGDVARMTGQSGPRAAWVPWASFPDDERGVLPAVALATKLGDRLAVIPHAGGWAGYRVLLVCARCSRTHEKGKRGLSRCWHEARGEDGDWLRCACVVAPLFCEEHRTRAARYARDTESAREAPGNVPFLVAREDPEDSAVLDAVREEPTLLELVRIVREAKDGKASAADVHERQRRFVRALGRLADAPPQRPQASTTLSSLGESFGYRRFTSRPEARTR